MSTLPNHVDFPEFEVADDLLNAGMINSVEAIEEKARSLSRLSTPSWIHSRQREFQREISAVADASFGSIFFGLLFVFQISVSLNFFSLYCNCHF